MRRYIMDKLVDWKNRTNRKPLILKGARQVGKTYILKEFGEEDLSIGSLSMGLSAVLGAFICPVFAMLVM